MKNSSKKRTTAKERELTRRIRELEQKLAASVPKGEFESVKSNLQSEISDLKTRLSVSEIHATQAESSEPATGGRLDEDGFEEGETEGLAVEISQMGPTTGDLATEESEESERDSEDAEDS